MGTGKIIDTSKTDNYHGAGVYAIINKRNGKMYIGSSVNLSNRVRQHDRTFQTLQCNMKLEEDVKKGDTFYSEILETIELPCKQIELLQLERKYSAKYNVVDDGYNEFYVAVYQSNKKILEKREPQNKNSIHETSVELGDQYERYKKAADDCGLSLREFVLSALEEKISRS